MAAESSARNPESVSGVPARSKKANVNSVPSSLVVPASTGMPVRTSPSSVTSDGLRGSVGVPVAGLQ